MKNKIYLVSGGGGGIGSAIIKKIAENIEEGTIIVHYNSNKKSAMGLKNSLETEKIKVELFKADLEDKQEVKSFCENVLSKFGRVDVLINNAGFVEDKELSERTYEDFEKTVKINLLSNFYLTKVFGQKMFENKFGRIVNLSSTNGLIWHSGTMCPTSIDYDVAKAGINALTKDFAIEFAPYVNVNAVAPGWVDTPMNFDLPEDVRLSENEKILKNRWATPEEVAELVWFLCSDKADFVNGSIYVIDGGIR